MQYDILDVNSYTSTLYHTSYTVPRGYYSITHYGDLIPDYSPPRYYHYSLTTNVNIGTNDLYDIKNRKFSEQYKNILYPMAVRYISKNGTYVVERPPFQLEVDYRIGSAYSGHPKMPPIKIWVPWTVMVFSANAFANGDFTNAELYFNSGPLESMDQMLIGCFYPNTYSNSRICFSNSLADFGSVLDTTEFEKGNIGYIYNYIFNNYMMGGWNSDLDQNLNKFNVPQVDKIDIDKYPTIKLFYFPTIDPEFYKKLLNVFPKEFFKKLKKYYQKDFILFKNSISKEKAFARNFGIFSVFTLEQKINFIKELQQFSEENKSKSFSSETLTQIIDRFEKQFNGDQIPASPTAITRMADAPLVYDYRSTSFDIYCYNCPPNQSSYYNIALSNIEPHLYSEIHKNMIDHINFGEDKPIAFAVDVAKQTYEVIINYDRRSYLINEIEQIQKTLREFVSQSSSPKTINSYEFKRLQSALTIMESPEYIVDNNL